MSTIRLVLGGDVMLGRNFNDIFDSDYDFNPWGNTKSLTSTGDIFSANLETTITNYSKKWPDKRFNYRMNPQDGFKLLEGNFNYLSLANNHILDYRRQGVIDTMSNLDKLGIWYSGAGLNITQARQSVYFKIDKPELSMRVNYLSASNYFSEWSSGSNNEGIWYIDIENWEAYKENVINRIKDVRINCDILVFNMHFGPNWLDCPSDSMRQFAHDIICAGVDILQGHSAHHVLPLEVVKREIKMNENIKTDCGVVFYSLGCLIDDYVVNKKYRNDLGLLCCIDIDKMWNKNVKLFPTKISNYQVNLLTDDDLEYHYIIDRLTQSF